MPIAAGRPTTPNDARNHEAGMLLIGVGAVLLLISLFLEWYQRGTDAFEAFEVWDLVLAVLAIGTLTAVASRFGFGPVRPASWLIGPIVAALVIVLFALLNPPPVAAAIDDDASTGLWLAFAATILMSIGALLSVARISVSLAAGRVIADPRARHSHPVAGPGGDPAYREPVAPRAGRRFGRGANDPAAAAPVAPVAPGAPGAPVAPVTPGAPGAPVDPVAPDAVAPTEPTRRI